MLACRLLRRAPSRGCADRILTFAVAARCSRAVVGRLAAARSRFVLRTAWSARTLRTLSEATGPREPPLLDQTVPEHFAGVVDRFGDRPAVISWHQKTILTYKKLDSDSSALARGLQKRGMGKGDRVAVCLGNTIEYAIITYALFKLGAILVPLNPAFTTAQVVSALTHLTAAHLIISTETCLPRKPPRSNIALLASILPDLNSSQPLQSPAVSSLQSIIIVDNSVGRVDVSGLCALTRYQDVVEDGNENKPLKLKPDEPLKPHEIVNIQFTSGTTSTPKAACLAHHSILNNGNSIGDRMRLTEKDVVCCPPPLFHCFGSILGYMATATHGSALVLPSEAFDPQATINSLTAYTCTALYGVPTMFLSVLDVLAETKSPRIPPLRTGIAAGTSVPAQLISRLHETLGLPELTNCYGMTETSPVSCMTAPDDPLQKRLETVGKLLPHVSAKIVGADGEILPRGHRGELAVSGYLLMKGYWGDEQRSAEVLKTDENGTTWMHTGDEASMDADFYVRITGRIKDLIIRGGENIHPLEVEDCVRAHPAVADVAVVGLPDERYGEAVAAFVVRRKGGSEAATEGDTNKAEADELRAWVRGRLSHHLVPKYIVWVDSYPKTASGKIQKFRLREMGVKMLTDGRGLI